MGTQKWVTTEYINIVETKILFDSSIIKRKKEKNKVPLLSD